jgi:hypothetical protein
MTPSITTRIATLAAQLVADGRVRTVEEAIRVALDRLDAPPRSAPSAGVVRQHLQPLLMQSLGAEGYPAMTRERLELAESAMTVLATPTETLDVVLAGRAAKGQLDGDVTLHIRVYTPRRIADIAQDLVDAGFEEPRFSTAETRFGRLDRLEIDDGKTMISITRCLPQQRREAERDLYNGARIPTLRLPELEKRLREPPRPERP